MQTARLIEHADHLNYENMIQAKNDEIARLRTLVSEDRIINSVVSRILPPQAVPAYAAANPYSTFTPTVNVASTGCAGVF